MDMYSKIVVCNGVTPHFISSAQSFAKNVG